MRGTRMRRAGVGGRRSGTGFIQRHGDQTRGLSTLRGLGRTSLWILFGAPDRRFFLLSRSGCLWLRSLDRLLFRFRSGNHPLCRRLDRFHLRTPDRWPFRRPHSLAARRWGRFLFRAADNLFSGRPDRHIRVCYGYNLPERAPATGHAPHAFAFISLFMPSRRESQNLAGSVNRKLPQKQKWD